MRKTSRVKVICVLQYFSPHSVYGSTFPSTALTLNCCLQLLTWADVAISDFLTRIGGVEDRLRPLILPNALQWFRNKYSQHELPESS